MNWIETCIRAEDFLTHDAADYNTPKPVQKKGKVVNVLSESEQAESEDENFETPKALKKRVVDDPVEVVSSTDGSKFSDWVQDDSDTTNESKNDSESDNQLKKSKRRMESNTFNSESRNIDLTKVRRNTTQKEKDKRAFRKEVKMRREETQDINHKVC